jgi:hypothetical protein
VAFRKTTAWPWSVTVIHWIFETAAESSQALMACTNTLVDASSCTKPLSVTMRKNEPPNTDEISRGYGSGKAPEKQYP